MCLCLHMNIVIQTSAKHRKMGFFLYVFGESVKTLYEAPQRLHELIINLVGVVRAMSFAFSYC